MPDAPVIRGFGHSVRRKEDPRFIRGQGNYIDDVKLPGMLYMDIVRSPYAHAMIKSIDASAALKAPGVVAVITGKDLEAAGLAWMPTLMSDTQMVLPTDHVVYQSQEVAAVLAETRYAAADAITLVEVEYEPLEPVIDPFKALEADSPLVDPTKRRSPITSGTGKSAIVPQRRPPSTPPMSSSPRTFTFRASMWRRSRRAAVSPATTGSAAS